MYLPNFNFHKPDTLQEAMLLLESLDNAAPIAGGTDLLVEIKQGIRKFDNIVSLNNIDELKHIREDEDNIVIGSGVTHEEIIESDIVNKYLPSLAQTCSTIGSHQIRNTATIGGNLCTCASCADSAPILICHDASVEISSTLGKRIIKLTEFLKGHHFNDLNKGELLTNIIISKSSNNMGSHFEKFGLRNSAAISVASVAVSLSIEDEKVVENCIVVGASAATPIECPKSVEMLNGTNLSELTEGSDFIKKLGESVAKEIFPIDDIRGSGNYRKDVVRAISGRTILKALANRGENK
jgi:aerobic carbon-monoxide dehydrogenase medium subunit